MLHLQGWGVNGIDCAKGGQGVEAQVGACIAQLL